MRFGIIVAPKLHQTRTKRFTPTYFYLGDKPSRARCGKLASWQLSIPLSFSLTRGKGSIAFTVSPPPIVFRFFAPFAMLSTRGARTLFGARGRCMQLHATSRVF